MTNYCLPCAETYGARPAIKDELPAGCNCTACEAVLTEPAGLSKRKPKSTLSKFFTRTSFVAAGVALPATALDPSLGLISLASLPLALTGYLLGGKREVKEKESIKYLFNMEDRRTGYPYTSSRSSCSNDAYELASNTALDHQVASNQGWTVKSINEIRANQWVTGTIKPRIKNEPSRLSSNLTPLMPTLPRSLEESGFKFHTEDRIWAQARERHREVTDAWTEVVADPLSALEHSHLLDVTKPHTANFIEAYGALTDFFSVLEETQPYSRKDLDHYASLTRSALHTWELALEQSRRSSYRWLPDEEQVYARKASGLLQAAADEANSFAARAAYASKALDFLMKITTVVLPLASLQSIETSFRELEARALEV